MHWADKIAKEIVDSGRFTPFWVDDMKTPSGFAHVGSLMGPVLHSIIYRALKDTGKKATYTFVINDFDPVDGLSEELKKDFGKYMGYPLKTAPSPDPKYKNMADLYSTDFINSFRALGVEAKILSSWEMYHEGKFDEEIKLALDNAEKIQDIYQKVSGSQKREKGWLPFQVICEKCGKIGTNRVFAWDGKEVSYKCEPSMVTWAEGCGHEGKISPFGGTGKLPWKVDWAAHWKVIGVTVEGAGKDHASAGGSYDIAMTIVKEVFGYKKPYKLPYEFVLIGGRKMSSSKGLGIKAHDLVNIVPAELGRFLYARANIKQQSNFDPVGTMAIPDLFDDYDRSWQAFNKNDKNLGRAFELSQIKSIPERNEVFLPRFRDIANYIQQPGVDVQKKFEEIKGSKLDKKEKEILDERIKYTKIWLSKYAPKEDVVAISDSLPEAANNLSEDQKKYLKELGEMLDSATEPEKFQVDIYNKAKEMNVPTKDAFSAIYLSLIGRPNGPKAAWFLLSLPKNKVLKRLKEVSK